ncbi:MAG: hypothetical protein AMXMBFR49_07650 [Chlorobiota bacterium]
MKTNFILALSIAIVLLSGCSNSDQPDEILETEKGKTYSKSIGPGGGVLDCGDGTKLEIPAGSLLKEEKIKIIQRKSGSSDQKLGTTVLQMEPDGLTFTKPAKITVSYPADSRSSKVNFYAYSCQNGNWEELKLVDNDAGAKEITFEVNHFSMIVIGTRDLYLVLDIPGKYLRKGDLIFTLALLNIQVEKNIFPGFHWFPGHVGMYIGKAGGNLDNDELIIESAPNSVRWNELNNFISDQYHLYMGPRRFRGNLTDEQLTQITEFAINQKGKKYSKVGQGNPVEISNGGFSCVGLTEAAYDQANPSASIIPAFMEFPFSLPIDQFNFTKPVDNISVLAGEPVSIKVYGVSWSDKDKYTKTDEGLSVENIPTGSRFYKEGDSYIFEWTPKEKDVNTNVNIRFNINGESSGHSGIVSQDLTINVVAPPFDFGNSFLPKEWFDYYDGNENPNIRFINGHSSFENSNPHDGAIWGQISLKFHYISGLTHRTNDYLILYEKYEGANGKYPGILYVNVDRHKNLKLVQRIEGGYFGSKLKNNIIVTYYPSSQDGKFQSYAEMRSSPYKEAKYFKFSEDENKFILVKTEVIKEPYN